MTDHHEKCPDCGARNTIPKTGLTTRCEYCGFERPVPDAEKRRKRMEKEEARRRKQEEAEREAASRQAHQKQMKKRASVGRLVALLLTVVPLIVVGSVLHSRGTIDLVTARIREAFGQDAQHHFNNEADRLRGEGYLQQTPPRTGSGVGSFPVSLKHGFCYALVVGSDAPVRHIELIGPEPATISAGRLERNQATLRHCPGRDSLSQVRVRLAASGKVVWSLYSKPVKAIKSTKTTKPAPRLEVTRSARRQRGMKSYSSRASRSRPAVQRRSKQQPQQPPTKAVPPDPTSSGDLDTTVNEL